MSSLRNSLHRRNHKERSQLSHRARFGFLEKHKDYVLRARDYHSKQDRLQRMRQKAAERNKDEFYFGMNRERTKGGVHIHERGNQALPTDMIKVLKTQDENYIRTMRTAGLKKIDKLKNQLTTLVNLAKPSPSQDDSEDTSRTWKEETEVLRAAGLTKAPVNSQSAPTKHIVFVDDKIAALQYAKRVKTEGTSSTSKPTSEVAAPIDLGWKPSEAKSSKKRRRKLSATDEQDEGNTSVLVMEPSAEQHRTQLLKELSARLVRDKQLRYAARELEMQRLLIGKGRRKKLQGVEKVEDEEEVDENNSDDDLVDHQRSKPAREATYRPRVYKWKMERKR